MKCLLHWVLVLLFWLGEFSNAHELCPDTSGPERLFPPGEDQSYCSADVAYSEGPACCVNENGKLKEKIQSWELTIQSQSCKNWVKKMGCARCDPWGAHLFGTELDVAPNGEFPFLCENTCKKFYNDCQTENVKLGDLLLPKLTFEKIIALTGNDKNDIRQPLKDTVSENQWCSALVESSTSYCWDGTPFTPQSGANASPTEGKNGAGVCLAHTSIGGEGYLEMVSVPQKTQNDKDYLLLANQVGKIDLVQQINDTLSVKRTVLDISDRVWRNGERGLLGMALYNETRLFVHYSCPKWIPDCVAKCNMRFGCPYDKTTCTGDNDCAVSEHVSVIAEYQIDLSENGEIGTNSNAKEIRKVMIVPQPFGNHNGGQIIFDPNNQDLLFIFFGDGGSGNDPLRLTQSPSSLMGKIVRIRIANYLSTDILQPSLTNPTYAIPFDNPFVGNSKVWPEYWAYGLRNPWRCSFDTLTEKEVSIHVFFSFFFSLSVNLVFIAHRKKSIYNRVDCFVEMLGKMLWKK